MIGCLTSKSEALLAGFFSTWLRKIVLYLFLLMDLMEGILKDNAITQNTKMPEKVVKLFTNYNLLTICLTIATSLIQAKSDKLQFPSMFINTS